MANNIKTIRKANGLTQQRLADLLGVSAQAISNFERAESLTVSTLLKLADALNVMPGDLITSDNTELFDKYGSAFFKILGITLIQDAKDKDIYSLYSEKNGIDIKLTRKKLGALVDELRAYTSFKLSQLSDNGKA